eukprot:gene1097-19503_t
MLLRAGTSRRLRAAANAGAVWSEVLRREWRHRWWHQWVLDAGTAAGPAPPLGGVWRRLPARMEFANPWQPSPACAYARRTTELCASCWVCDTRWGAHGAGNGSLL